VATELHRQHEPVEAGDHDEDGDTGSAGGEPVITGADAGPGLEGPGAAGRSVHRLRDLSGRGKAVAGLLAVALVSAHALAVAHYWGDWMPGGDVALMGIRSLDAFTSMTPLVGQPSTSGLYGGLQRHAFHPGPMQFYMMAPGVRVLGSTAGMMATAVVITASSVLVSAWALFRQLGAAAGVVGAVLISAVMFTTGAAVLINPISSVVSGYPLLCSAVLVYCLLCGDDRLLPLTVLYLSFAGQAHLAVGPAVGFLVAAGVAGVAATWWRAGIRRDAAVRRHALRWGGGSLLLGAALWTPVAYQQLTGDPGNVTALVTFTADSDRPVLGLDSAVGQVAHTLGWPPILGRTDLSGADFTGPVPVTTWVTAAAVLAVLAVAAIRWRASAPRRSALVIMVGVLVAAALVTGSSVPDSLESSRRAFYHWAWPMTLFATLALALLVVDTLRAPVRHRLTAPARRVLAVTAVGVAVVAMVVPAVGGLAMERRVDRLAAAGTTHPAAVWSSLIDQMIDAGIGDVDGKLVVVHAHAKMFDGTQEALSLGLMERGFDVGFPEWMRDFVAGGRIVTIDDVGAVLLVVTEGLGGPPEDVPGREIAWAPLVDGLDRQALDDVVAMVEGTGPDAVVPGPELERLLAGRSETERSLTLEQLRDAFRRPAWAFTDPAMVDLLLQYPTSEPAIDRDALVRLRRVLDHLAADDVDLQATALSVRLVEPSDAVDLMHTKPPTR
jgi:hypothetical protein